MFRNKDIYVDLSLDLRDAQDWSVGVLRTFDYPLDISVLATEPVSGLLAVGTTSGVIYIFGGPGIESKLPVSDSAAVSFLQFSISTHNLICIDSYNRLHVWDLSNYGGPKFSITARFDAVSCLTVSPSHAHAFVALESGEIRTFDLACLRKSPYIIPNMWSLYEEKMRTSGISDTHTTTAHTPVETVIHPRDLNLLFVAYSGGVILSDLTQRSTLRAYEYILGAGAPGGFGYSSMDLLTHRRPAVTALAVHPAGHYFAVGYADGSIAFWAVEDEEKPILVRTLDDLDVNKVDGQKLEEHLASAEGVKAPSSSTSDREPIFKLAWCGFPNSSDPRGGETTLIILGGLLAGDALGLTVLWLPAFNPPEPPTSISADTGYELHPFTRQAIRDSVIPTKTYFYVAPGLVQDFLLIPRNSPHFSGNFDPTSIIILSEALGNTRAIEAYQFPPPSFLENKSGMIGSHSSDAIVGMNVSDSLDTLSADLADTLKELAVDDEPRRFGLPPTLCNGRSSILDGHLIKLEREVYETLVSKIFEHKMLPLDGGFAWENQAGSKELKLSKYQPHRVLLTYHQDLTVQIHDISAQLLMGPNSNSIQTYFPNSLPDLTIDLPPILADPSVLKRISPSFLERARARIDSARLSTESLECVVVLESGELFLFRLNSNDAAPFRKSDDTDIVILEHIPKHPSRRFRPYFMLAPGKGPVTACAISDIGFLGVGYADGSIFVVDLRGPRVILRCNQNVISKRGPSVGFHLAHHSEVVDPPRSLTFAVCSITEDLQPGVRLIIAFQSGSVHIYTIHRPSGSSLWVVDGNPTVTETIANPLPQSTFMLDSGTGAQMRASPERLSTSLSHTQVGETKGIWVTASAKGARCIVDITGERLGKVEWGGKIGAVQSIQVVERNGSHALVAFTDKLTAVVYSLPHLELLHTLQLAGLSTLRLQVDESGDFLSWKRHPASGLAMQATYASLFDIRRSYAPPDVEFTIARRPVPPQPQPVPLGPTSLLRSWFRFGVSMTGEQLDALLGGPDRPDPQPRPQKLQPTSSSSQENNLYANKAGAVAKAAVAGQSSLFDRLNSALGERGQMLGDLEDRFSSLEEGSRSMVAQAKRLATQQTAKGWFGL